MENCNFCGGDVSGNICSVCNMFVKRVQRPIEIEEKPAKQKKEPRLLTKAKNVSIAVTKHAKNRFRNISENKQKKRLEICQKCEYYNESNISCRSCGCYLLVKTSWASESCPEGKWQSEKSDQKSAPLFKNPCGGCGKKN
jgi:hypothetical protein